MPHLQEASFGARLEGKVAIVTGGARGLGACVSALFAAHGARVLVTDILDDEGALVAEAIRGNGGAATYRRLDVTSEADWAAAVEAATSEFGVPDVLVLNAFFHTPYAILDESLPGWTKALGVNLNGPFLGLQAVLPGMIELGHGSVVAVSSTNGADVAFPTQAAYQAAKAGLTALTRHVAVAHGADGIRANTVHPGPIRTPALTDQPEFIAAVEILAKTFPVGRVAEPIELANAILFLASDESSYVTGTRLLVDGGSTTGMLPATPDYAAAVVAGDEAAR